MAGIRANGVSGIFSVTNDLVVAKGSRRVAGNQAEPLADFCARRLLLFRNFVIRPIITCKSYGRKSKCEEGESAGAGQGVTLRKRIACFTPSNAIGGLFADFSFLPSISCNL